MKHEDGNGGSVLVGMGAGVSVGDGYRENTKWQYENGEMSSFLPWSASKAARSMLEHVIAPARSMLEIYDITASR